MPCFWLFNYLFVVNVLIKSETIDCNNGCWNAQRTCTSNPCVINCNNGGCQGTSTILNCGNNPSCTINCNDNTGL